MGCYFAYVNNIKCHYVHCRSLLSDFSTLFNEFIDRATKFAKFNTQLNAALKGVMRISSKPIVF